MTNFSSMFGDPKVIATGVTGRDITAAPAPVQAAPKKSLWENIFSTATEVARTAGVKMPMESELASLSAKRKELVALSHRAKSISAQVGRQLAARRDNPASVAASVAVAKACSQACNQAQASIKLIDAAMADGNLAVEKMRYGTGAFKPSATFYSKKAVADRVFSLAKNRLMLVITTAESKQRQHFGNEALPTLAVKAAGSTVKEFGGLVTRGLVKTGTAVREAASGAEALAPLARYAVPIGLGLVGLYALSLLPRPRSND